MNLAMPQPRTTELPSFDGETVRKIIDAAAQGKTLSQRVRTYADEVGISETAMWRYLRYGTQPKTPANVKRCLIQDAKVHHIQFEQLEMFK